MKKIKYIAFYDLKNDEENRNAQVSAINKVDYISKIFVSLGYYVEIVSPSWTENESGWYKKKSEKMSRFIGFKNFYTFGTKTKMGKISRYLFSMFQLLIYLIFNLKKHETIVVYHSNMIFPVLFLLKILKNVKIILEIEEIYQDIQSNNKILRFFENKSIQLAKAYILSTNELKSKIPKNTINAISIEGNYLTVEEKNENHTDEYNEKIHLVYAGTFDPLKGGAKFSVEIGEFLSSKYHMHIIGFGSKKDEQQLLEKIKSTNLKSQATITYEGLKIGKEYSDLLRECHIGLSTQSSNEKFNQSSFPSKILSYMGHGLKVVSANIDVVKNSRVGNYITYYESENAYSVAKIIEDIEIEDSVNYQEILEKLNCEIKIEMSKVLEDVNRY